MHLKRIKLDHATNIRDMGGYSAKDNKTVKWNMLYRSDGLGLLTKPEWDILYAAGVRTVIDLRSTAEVCAHPDNIPSNFDYLHLPVQAEDTENTTAENAFYKSLTAGYRDIAENNPNLVANALTGIVSSLKKGAVLFHCSAGKDRTGVIAALLYLILGVDSYDIIADYQVSCTYNEAAINNDAPDNPIFSGFPHLKYSKAEYMSEFIEYCQCSGIFSKLSSFGFTDNMSSTLCDLVLE